MSSSATGATMLALTGGNGNPAAPPALLTVIQQSMTSWPQPGTHLRRIEALAQHRNSTLGHTGSLADAYDAAWRTIRICRRAGDEGRPV
jgi:hypothetical protein